MMSLGANARDEQASNTALIAHIFLGWPVLIYFLYSVEKLSLSDPAFTHGNLVCIINS